MHTEYLRLETFIARGGCQDDLVGTARRFGILAQDALAYIHDVAAVVREWRAWFDEFDIPRNECDKVASAFHNPKDIGLALVR